MAIVYETKWSGIHAWHRFKAGEMHHHMHDYVEVLYVKSGEMHVYINFEEFILTAGDVAVVFPGQIHGHQAATAENFVLLFPKNLPVFDAVFCNTLPSSPIIKQGVDEETDKLFRQAAIANSPEVPFRKGVTQGYIALILGALLPSLELFPAGKNEATIEQRLIEYCSMHYREQISLSSVAEALGYSPTHLSHLFTDKFKIGFSKFITIMRLEDAKKMLRGDKSITQIALDCGFGSMRNFNRTFKEHAGKTPSEYRIKS